MSSSHTFLPPSHTFPHTQGALAEGWRDSEGGDLWDATWRAARRVSPNLTPALLAPRVAAGGGAAAAGANTAGGVVVAGAGSS